MHHHTTSVHSIAKSVSKSGVAPFNSLHLNTISSLTFVGSPNVHSRKFPYCAAMPRVYSMLLMNGKQIISVVVDASCARESRNWYVSVDIMCRISVQCTSFVALSQGLLVRVKLDHDPSSASAVRYICIDCIISLNRLAKVVRPALSLSLLS